MMITKPLFEKGIFIARLGDTIFARKNWDRFYKTDKTRLLLRAGATGTCERLLTSQPEPLAVVDKRS